MSQNAVGANIITRKLAERSLFLVSGQQSQERVQGYKVNPYFHVHQESYGEESVFYPAQHVSIHSEKEIKALRDFLTEILNEKETQ